MSWPVSLASLLSSATRDQILAKMIGIAQTIGIATESWLAGDPTRGFFMAQSARQAEWEDPTTGFPVMIAGGFLGLAEGDWLTNLSGYNYNTPRITATYAQPPMTVTNATAQDYGTFEVNDMTVSDPLTGATYRNTTAFTLGPNATVTGLIFEADVAGSFSNADVGDINELVTTLDGVTVTNTAAAVAFDDEEDPALTARAQSKFESTSPDGPRGAYTYALTTPSMQPDAAGKFEDDPAYAGGTTNVTRVRTVDDDDYGEVVCFIAGDSGELSSADQTKAQTTLEKWSEPIGLDASAVLATNVTIAIAYTLYLYDSINLTTAEIEAQVATFLGAAFKQRPIGGDSLAAGDVSGYIFQDWIRTQIVQAVAPYAFECEVTAPAADVPLDLTPFFGTTTPPSAQVAVVGTITPTIVIVAAPQ